MRIALAMLAVAAISFAAGYEIARQTTSKGGLEQQLAAIRSDIAALKSAPAPAAAPTQQRRRGPDPSKVYDVTVGKSPSKGPADAAATVSSAYRSTSSSFTLLHSHSTKTLSIQSPLPWILIATPASLGTSRM